MAIACQICLTREDDPRRLIDLSPIHVFKARHCHVHVACWLARGNSIEGLADAHLWHVSTKDWQRLGYLPGDSHEEYARVRREEREQAHLAIKVPTSLLLPIADGEVSPSHRRRRGREPQARRLPLFMTPPSAKKRTPPQRSLGRRQELRRAA